MYTVVFYLLAQITILLKRTLVSHANVETDISTHMPYVNAYKIRLTDMLISNSHAYFGRILLLAIQSQLYMLYETN